MKQLHIALSDGERRTIDESGRITRYRLGEQPYQGSDQWTFLGFSFHHWSNRIQLSLAGALADPSRIEGKRLYGWDRDHGTTRRWGNPYITRAYVENVRIKNL